MENLIPDCKNIGTIHITNGYYRLHPIEWHIGEAAGLLSAFSLTHRLKPRLIYQNEKLLQSLQTTLLNQGIELIGAADANSRVKDVQIPFLSSLFESSPDGCNFPLS